MGGPEMAPHPPQPLVAPRRGRGAPRPPTLVAPRRSRGAPRPPTFGAPRQSRVVPLNLWITRQALAAGGEALDQRAIGGREVVGGQPLGLDPRHRLALARL